MDVYNPANFVYFFLFFFRSELMVHKRIRIPKDIAFEVMDELGKLEDAVEFIDLTKDEFETTKNFFSMIKRCDEMDRKIL